MNNKKSLNKKLKIPFIIILSLIILVVLTAGIVAVLIYNKIHTSDVPIVTRDNTYTTPEFPTDVIPGSDYTGSEWTEPTDTPSSGTDPIYSVEPIEKDIINILVLGCDTLNPKVDRGRSDTMLIMSYNRKSKEISIISLLRDSLVPIEGYGWNRINTAYFFGGVGLCVNTVNQVFGLDIQNYITIDFEGFVSVIDEIGGVPVNLTQAEVDYYNSRYAWGVSAGKTLLSGQRALTHARNRTLGSDFARTERQRSIIEAVIKKILVESSVTETVTRINKGLDYVKTNMSLGTLTSLTYDVFAKGINKINSSSVPYTGVYTNVWYRGMLVLQIDIPEISTRIRDIIYG